jgi:flagellar motor switch/type III secretory pathway protein FliN
MDRQELDRYLNVPLLIEAVIEGPALRVRDLLSIRVGSTIHTEMPAGENVTILAGSAELGQAELSVRGSRSGARMICFRPLQ